MKKLKTFLICFIVILLVFLVKDRTIGAGITFTFGQFHFGSIYTRLSLYCIISFISSLVLIYLIGNHSPEDKK